MQTTELTVEGMMCQACVGHVSKALQNVSGVQNVEVELDKGRARVQHENVSADALVEAVREDGYEARVAA